MNAWLTTLQPYISVPSTRPRKVAPHSRQAVVDPGSRGAGGASSETSGNYPQRGGLGHETTFTKLASC